MDFEIFENVCVPYHRIGPPWDWGFLPPLHRQRPEKFQFQYKVQYYPSLTSPSCKLRSSLTAEEPSDKKLSKSPRSGTKLSTVSGPLKLESNRNIDLNEKTFRGDGCAALGTMVETEVGVVESFAELLDDLFEYDMSGIAAGARTFTYYQKDLTALTVSLQCFKSSTRHQYQSQIKMKLRGLWTFTGPCIYSNCMNTSTVFEGCPATMEDDGDGAT